MSETRPQPPSLLSLLAAGIFATVTVGYAAVTWQPTAPALPALSASIAPQQIVRTWPMTPPRAPRSTVGTTLTVQVAAARMAAAPAASPAAPAAASPAAPLAASQAAGPAVAPAVTPAAPLAAAARPVAATVHRVAAQTRLRPVAAITHPAPAASADRLVPAERIVVRRGDTLWGIAQARYGKGIDYPAIVRANPGRITRANLIRPGQSLVLPALTLPPATVARVMVHAGQTLWQIARTAYGAGQAWPMIARVNGIGASARIHPGQLLTVPPRPA